MTIRSDGGGLDAIVVGAGPNGLAAAITLARAGRSVRVYEAAPEAGGGTRTAELTLPGFRHDVCSTILPLTLASPFFRTIDLAAHGVELVQPDAPVAHPLDGGRAVVLERSVSATANGLGAEDGRAWRRLFAPLVRDADKLGRELLRPVPHLPRHPLALARFGRLAAKCYVTPIVERFDFNPVTAKGFVKIPAARSP
jgi:phytoene dehydrogenase-like protein